MVKKLVTTKPVTLGKGNIRSMAAGLRNPSWWVRSKSKARG